MAVLVLKPLTVERGATGGGPQHEAAAARISECPRQIPGALEAEHRIEDVEGDGGSGVGGVGGACGSERGHGAGLGDAFFQDLTVLRLAIAEHEIGIHGLVLLTEWGVDLDFFEQPVHAKGAGFVGDDGHHQLTDDRVAQQRADHAGEHHGGGHGHTATTTGELAECWRVQFRGHHWLRLHDALGY